MGDFIKEIIQELNQLKEENKNIRKERNKFKKQYRKNRIERKKLEQKLERIKDIVTQINFTVAGGDESPKHEWIRLYSNIVYEVSKIINEVK